MKKPILFLVCFCFCSVVGFSQKTGDHQLSALVVNIDSVVNVSCFAMNDGEATAFASGGVPPYNYIWNTTFTDSTHTGLPAGTYTVTVTDNSSSTAIDSITITEPSQIIVSFDTTTATCNDSNGVATTNLSGGTPPYTYLWNNAAHNQTTQAATGLAGGNYDVTITDANGCTEVATAIIGNIGGVTISFTTTIDSCNATGTASASPSGSSPYTYQWDDNASNQTTQTATGLAAGNYLITVTDNDGCSVVDTAMIVTTSGLFVEVTATNENCGNGDGTATANASGGPTPYTYQWSDSTNATTASVTGLGAGTYQVMITDDSGCSVVKNVTINDVGSLSVFGSSTLEHCGQSNATATVGTTGGTLPFTYSWDDTNNQTTPTATGLSEGIYTIIVVDNVGCTDSAAITIISTDGPILNAPDPEADCDSLTVFVIAGGSSPFTFLWSNNATNDSIIVANASETYTVTVTDNFGCTKIDSVITTEAINCEELEIPSAFTPNADGKNDTWILKGIENQSNLTVEIFNRWGQLLYSSTGYSNPWNGTLDGKELPTGVYYYIVSSLNNEPQHGSVTIVR